MGNACAFLTSTSRDPPGIPIVSSRVSNISSGDPPIFTLQLVQEPPNFDLAAAHTYIPKCGGECPPPGIKHKQNTGILMIIGPKKQSYESLKLCNSSLNFSRNININNLCKLVIWWCHNLTSLHTFWIWFFFLACKKLCSIKKLWKPVPHITIYFE